MTDGGWFYTATDIARPLVDGEVPAMKQYAFLDWLREMERPFLPRQWREGNAGRRAMLLDVQNAIAYLVDSESFEADRDAVEDEGGILPACEAGSGVQAFLKKLRLEMAFREFLGRKDGGQKRMKCRAILKKCGISRRSDIFCREFAMSAAFYHVWFRAVGNEKTSFSISRIPLGDMVVVTRN